MDEQRFDQLARSLASGKSRRGVLKGLAGMIGGALGLGVTASAEARANNPNGTPCASPRDCATGLCVDGICCDAACPGPCEACNVSGLEGICSPVAGAPVGNRGPCPGDGGPCSGFCDGITTNRCAGYPGGETVCGESACANGMVSGLTCSGNGLCTQATSHCGLYGCAADGIACATGCTDDSECAGDAFCVGGVCQGDLPQGSPCERVDQCQSGQCVDGVCCDTACDGECQTCGADGFCADVGEGDACDGGVCCQGDCTPLGTEANCLACGNYCVNGDICCDGGCTDLGTNANCASCGDACVDGDICCDGGCTDLGTNANCSGCEDACVDGETCVNGECEGECLALGEECDPSSNLCCEVTVAGSTDNIQCETGTCGGADALCLTGYGDILCESGVCCGFDGTEEPRLGLCCADGESCIEGACQAVEICLGAPCSSPENCCEVTVAGSTGNIQCGSGTCGGVDALCVTGYDDILCKSGVCCGIDGTEELGAGLCCADGESCVNGVCTGEQCADLGDICGSPGDCCNQGYGGEIWAVACGGGICGGAGASCDAESAHHAVCLGGVCCDGACCAEGVGCVEGTCVGPAEVCLGEPCTPFEGGDICCDEADTCGYSYAGDGGSYNCCHTFGGACSKYQDCCARDGLAGTVDVTCSPDGICGGGGAVCRQGDDANCHSGICCRGDNNTAICCGAEEACIEGACVPQTCLTRGETCTGNDECCQSADICGFSGDGIDTVCCNEIGNNCASSSECCTHSFDGMGFAVECSSDGYCGGPGATCNPADPGESACLFGVCCATPENPDVGVCCPNGNVCTDGVCGYPVG